MNSENPALLLEIQRLQFSNKAAAEEKLLKLLKSTGFEGVTSLQLNPKPESLNSVNGFANFEDGRKFFFKSHVEEDEQIDEYYNARVLMDSGYPMITAEETARTPGDQIVFYEPIELPTLFDLAHEAEPDSDKDLVKAQERLDDQIFAIYEKTLTDEPVESTSAPIHQLFAHRLQEDARVGNYYRGKSINLPNGPADFDQIADKRWRINGVEYQLTLNELIERSRRLLSPLLPTRTVVGHGDAHNGNVWVDSEKNDLYYFDPAFAGRHSPILDLTKPLFHNVFARWMYFPTLTDSEFEISYTISEGLIEVEHDFIPSPLRASFLESKISRVLNPTVQLLNDDIWRDYLRAALFCCPFLTINLAATENDNGTLAERYPRTVKLLGLSMAITVGSPCNQGSSTLQDLVNMIFD